MRRLPPARFGLGNYDAGAIPNSIMFSNRPHALREFLREATIVGWTEEPTPYRPKPDCIAILFEMDGGEYWCHLDKDLWFLLTDKNRPDSIPT